MSRWINQSFYNMELQFGLRQPITSYERMLALRLTRDSIEDKWTKEDRIDILNQRISKLNLIKSGLEKRIDEVNLAILHYSKLEYVRTRKEADIEALIISAFSYMIGKNVKVLVHDDKFKKIIKDIEKLNNIRYVYTDELQIDDKIQEVEKQHNMRYIIKGEYDVLPEESISPELALSIKSVLSFNQSFAEDDDIDKHEKKFEDIVAELDKIIDYIEQKERSHLRFHYIDRRRNEEITECLDFIWANLEIKELSNTMADLITIDINKCLRSI